MTQSGRVAGGKHRQVQGSAAGRRAGHRMQHGAWAPRTASPRARLEAAVVGFPQLCTVYTGLAEKGTLFCFAYNDFISNVISKGKAMLSSSRCMNCWLQMLIILQRTPSFCRR